VGFIHFKPYKGPYYLGT